ncbi:flavin reductase family protein [Erythrobacter aureus]|jgi:3-hydroxy-9,10-secoandrosta-1,3,5(10)-triene-9,17-dione monooxygenase reductase component|uniref:flavin reductase family protein n=1 Tax=Erythrobacter aureus TaxID=2182384 RepID=UPI003A938785
MFDPQAFRDALGSFVTGVTIVTARDGEGRPFGLTANSFNSVSLDPPMVLWSLSLRSRTLPVFRDATSWAVHVLAADQQPMSDRFAQPGEDKFAGLAVMDGPEGAPLIEGYAARFGCRARFEYEGGDHAIFLGEVVDFDRREAAPLIYHGGRYGRVMRAPTGEDLEREGLAETVGGELSLTASGAELLAALESLAKR